MPRKAIVIVTITMISSDNFLFYILYNFAISYSRTKIFFKNVQKEYPSERKNRIYYVSIT